VWRKASYSASGGGNCIEVGIWRKASYSSSNGGACVEIGTAARAVAVRDSKEPDGPRLAFTPGSWQAFIRSIKQESTGRA